MDSVANAEKSGFGEPNDAAMRPSEVRADFSRQMVEPIRDRLNYENVDANALNSSINSPRIESDGTASQRSERASSSSDYCDEEDVPPDSTCRVSTVTELLSPYTPSLHQLIQLGHYKSIETWLCRNHFQDTLNDLDLTGRSPAHVALMSGDPRALLLLLYCNFFFNNVYLLHSKTLPKEVSGRLDLLSDGDCEHLNTHLPFVAHLLFCLGKTMNLSEGDMGTLPCLLDETANIIRSGNSIDMSYTLESIPSIQLLLAALMFAEQQSSVCQCMLHLLLYFGLLEIRSFDFAENFGSSKCLRGFTDSVGDSVLNYGPFFSHRSLDDGADGKNSFGVCTRDSVGGVSGAYYENSFPLEGCSAFLLPTFNECRRAAELAAGLSGDGRENCATTSVELGSTEIRRDAWGDCGPSCVGGSGTLVEVPVGREKKCFEGNSFIWGSVSFGKARLSDENRQRAVSSIGLNSLDADGCSMLDLCCGVGCAPVVHLLLLAGAHLSPTSEGYLDGLCVEIAPEFSDIEGGCTSGPQNGHGSVERCFRNEENPVFLAKGRCRLSKTLYDPYHERCSLFHHAIAGFHPEVVHLLFQYILQEVEKLSVKYSVSSNAKGSVSMAQKKQATERVSYAVELHSTQVLSLLPLLVPDPNYSITITTGSETPTYPFCLSPIKSIDTPLTGSSMPVKKVCPFPMCRSGLTSLLEFAVARGSWDCFAVMCLIAETHRQQRRLCCDGKKCLLCLNLLKPLTHPDLLSLAMTAIQSGHYEEFEYMKNGFLSYERISESDQNEWQTATFVAQYDTSTLLSLISSGHIREGTQLLKHDAPTKIQHFLQNKNQTTGISSPGLSAIFQTTKNCEAHKINPKMASEENNTAKIVNHISRQECTLVVSHPICLMHLPIPEPVDMPRKRFKLIMRYPENPTRLQVLVATKKGILKSAQFESGVFWNESPAPASLADILRVHDWTYISRLRKSVEESRLNWVLQKFTPKDADGDTPLTPLSWSTATLAAGAVIEAVRQVCTGKVRNAFCAVRPPGHHLGSWGAAQSANLEEADEPTGSQGFCLLNNVAIGAAYAKYNFWREGIRRIAIIDFDVHHGNGTEQIIRNVGPKIRRVGLPPAPRRRASHDDDLSGLKDEIMGAPGDSSQNTEVLLPIWRGWHDENDSKELFFASIHGYDGAFYPGTGAQCSKTECVGVCERWIVNVALSAGTGSKELREKFSRQILPSLRDFVPDLIMLSSGFDGHRFDPVSNGFAYYTERDFEWITEQVISVGNICCSGRVVSVLEGGYNTHAGVLSPFAQSVAAHVGSLAHTSPFKLWLPPNDELKTYTSDQQSDSTHTDARLIPTPPEKIEPNQSPTKRQKDSVLYRDIDYYMGKHTS